MEISSWGGLLNPINLHQFSKKCKKFWEVSLVLLMIQSVVGARGVLTAHSRHSGKMDEQLRDDYHICATTQPLHSYTNTHPNLPRHEKWEVFNLCHSLSLVFVCENQTQELRTLSSVTLDCQATKIVMNSQRSQVSGIALLRCSLKVFVFVIVFVFVFVFYIVFFWVRSCLLITLIKCLKGHKSLGLLLLGVL